MSLYSYKPKTKPALWTQVGRVADLRQELAAANELMKSAKALLKKSRKRSAALRKRAKAAFLARRRGKVAAKRPKRLRARSSAMEARMKLYRAAKARFLAAYPSCQCGCGRKSKEIHHKFGRQGDLLLWETGWIPVCSYCHQFIHSNIDWARQRNLIACPGEWNNQKLLASQPACV